MTDPLALLLEELKRDPDENSASQKSSEKPFEKRKAAQPKSLLKSKKKPGLCFGAKRNHSAGVFKVEKKKEWKDTINGIQIKDRTADADAMKCRLRKFTLLSLQEANARATAKSMPEMFAFYAVISEKSNRTSSKGNAYLLMKITDFDAEVTVMMFDAKVRAKYYRWIEGTVVCVGNPKLLDSKKKSSTASFIIEDENQMMKIGAAKGFGLCKGKGKDGLRCKRGVNVEKCEYCPFHFLQRRKNIEARRAGERKQQQSASSKKIDHHRFDDPIRRTKTMEEEFQDAGARRSRMKSLAGVQSGAHSRAITRFNPEKALQLAQDKRNYVAPAVVKTNSLPTQLKRKAPSNFMVPKGKKNKVSAIDKRLSSQDDLMIGLHRQAKPKNSSTTASTAKKGTPRNLDSELARLLGASSGGDIMSRKSKYEKVGKEDRVRKQEVRVACLVQEEREQEYKEKVQSVQGWAFICYHQGCQLKGKKLEKKNSVCVNKGHRIKTVQLQKHFYECQICKRKTHTFNKHMPLKSCAGCGKTKFKKASAYNTKAAVDIQREKKKSLQTVSKLSELRDYSSSRLKE